jgi:NitT/TauT family transport system ATP-binding protein
MSDGAPVPHPAGAVGAPDRAGAPTISVNGLTKTFAGDVVALQNISFAVGELQFVSILGPSGCGKSTLLRILAGLVSHERGGVQVAGRPVTSASDQVGVVFQTSNMLPWLTVSANIGLGAKIRGMPRKAIAERVGPMLETLSLTKFANAYPHQLSGGMRQRAAIGQALVLDPAILLMDEPFGALDALTRDKLNVELLRIWQEKMKTVVLVTHSIAEAVFLSDRVLVMSAHPGEIIEDMEITLPRPRHPQDTRADPRFGRYVSELGKLMGVV